MSFPIPEILEDELIKIVPLQSTDFEALYKVASDPAIWEQHPSKDRYKREVFQDFFDLALSTKSSFLIFEKAQNQLIGSTRYYEFDENRVKIGYTFLAKLYWGGKYNQAAKKLLLDYAFGFCDKILFDIGVNNKRSQLAIEKIGATLIAEVPFDEKINSPAHLVYQINKVD